MQSKVRIMCKEMRLNFKGSEATMLNRLLDVIEKRSLYTVAELYEAGYTRAQAREFMVRSALDGSFGRQEKMSHAMPVRFCPFW